MNDCLAYTDNLNLDSEEFRRTFVFTEFSQFDSRTGQRRRRKDFKSEELRSEQNYSEIFFFLSLVLVFLVIFTAIM